MIAYAPPAPIRMLVVTDDIDRPVQVVIAKARRMMSAPPRRPAFPITHPSRRYMMTPRMVSSVGVKTPPKVPNFL